LALHEVYDNIGLGTVYTVGLAICSVVGRTDKFRQKGYYSLYDYPITLISPSSSSIAYQRFKLCKNLQLQNSI